MTDLKVETGKFTSALKADEAQARGWIQRHPGYALTICLFELAVIGFLLLKIFA